MSPPKKNRTWKTAVAIFHNLINLCKYALETSGESSPWISFGIAKGHLKQGVRH